MKPTGKLPADSAQRKPSTYDLVRLSMNEMIDAADCDPTVTTYMFIRAGLLAIANHQGSERASELAYKLADEFALGVV